MADSSIPITPGAGADVDTRTAPDGGHRQVMVLGDPDTADVLALAVRGAVASLTAAGLPLMATRHDDDTIAVAADGDWSLLHTDEAGRLKVATQPGSVPLAQGTLTTTAAAATGLVGGAVAGVAGTIAYKVGRISNLMLHVKNTGTASLAAGTFVWEGSLDSTNGADGTWFGLQAVRSNANTIELQIAPATLAVGVGHASAWELSANGLAWVRIRCSVSATASSAATWSILPGTYATEPIPAAQASATQPVSGTVTAQPPTGTGSNTITTASTNAAVIKSSAGSVYAVTIKNRTATAAYVKLYNKSTAPTVGTDAPLMTFDAPAGSQQVIAFGTLGGRFSTGIGIAVTGGAADSDTTASVAGIIVQTTYI